MQSDHTEAKVAADIEVTDPSLLLKLTGPGGSNLRVLEAELGVSMGLRGSTIPLRNVR